MERGEAETGSNPTVDLAWLARARRAALAIAFAASLARPARATETLHAVAIVARDEDRRLLPRIVGQAADLDVVVDAVEAPAEADLAAQLKRADVVAAEHHATVVIWTLAQTDGLVLCISEPLAGRVLVRKVTSASGEVAESALLEQTALVVRSALRALAAGGVIGVERRVYEDANPAPVVRRRAPVATTPRKPALAELGGAGAEASVDSGGGHGAVALWLGVRGAAFEARLETSLGGPSDTRTPYLTFHVARHTVLFAFAAKLASSETVDLFVGTRAGTSLFFRSTRDPAAFIAPSDPSLTAAGLIGAELRLRWHPPAATWAVVLAVGADAVLGAPTFGIETGAGFKALYTPSWGIPRALLGLDFGTRAF